MQTIIMVVVVGIVVIGIKEGINWIIDLYILVSQKYYKESFKAIVVAIGNINFVILLLSGLAWGIGAMCYLMSPEDCKTFFVVDTIVVVVSFIIHKICLAIEDNI